MSENKPGVKQFTNVLIPMSDGTLLAANLWMPAADGKFPCILIYSPFHKDDFWGTSAMETLPDFFVKNGYCYALVDIRGTGSSGGSCTEMHSLQEQKDGYEVVEWLAAQPWCSGSIGMVGWSYGFSTCVLVAAQNPPHLKAIVPLYGNVDLYDSVWEGGSFVGFHFGGYLGSMMAAMNCMPPTHHDTDGRWLAMWKERLETNVPWIFGFFEHPTNDDFWKSKSARYNYERVKAATLAISGWNDLYPSGPAALYSGINCPKKLIMGPWMQEEPSKSIVGPRVDYYGIVLRWFEYWLKGEPNGVLEEPPILLYTAEYTPPDLLKSPDNPWMYGSWRREKKWPLKTEQMQFHVHPDRALKLDSSAENGFDFFDYDPSRGTSAGLIGGLYTHVGLPIDQRGDEVGSIVYATAALGDDLEVTGQPEVILSVSSSAEVAAVSVKLCDEAPDGTTVLLSRSYLNLTQRLSKNNPSLLPRSELCDVRIQMNLISYLFGKGHRIKLLVSGADFPHVWPTPKTCATNVHYGPDYATRLILPVVPRGPKDRTNLPSLPLPSGARDRLLEPDLWRVTQDNTELSVTVEWAREVEARVGQDTRLEQKWQVRETTYRNTPGATRLEGLHQTRVSKPGNIVNSKSRLLIQGDEKFFHVSVELDIEYDGAPHTKSVWTETYPRKLC